MKFKRTTCRNCTRLRNIVQGDRRIADVARSFRRGGKEDVACSDGSIFSTAALVPSYGLLQVSAENKPFSVNAKVVEQPTEFASYKARVSCSRPHL